MPESSKTAKAAAFWQRDARPPAVVWQTRLRRTGGTTAVRVAATLATVAGAGCSGSRAAGSTLLRGLALQRIRDNLDGQVKVLAAGPQKTQQNGKWMT